MTSLIFTQRKTGSSTVFEILNEAEIRSRKVRYYVEKRDSDFEEKMVTVLHVYREVDMINNGVIIPELKDTITISFYEKPGMQATSRRHRRNCLLFPESILLSRGIMSIRGWVRCLFWHE